jgi:hypothetical protein
MASIEKCPQEMCQNWTGMGCACAIYDLEPVIVEDDDTGGDRDTPDTSATTLSLAMSRRMTTCPST